MKRFFISLVVLFGIVTSCYPQVKITMQKKDGVYTIPCKVNGLHLKFIFDTGASDVVISASEAIFMLKNGYLSYNDLKGTTYSQIANGEIVENTSVIIKEIEIGGMKINNISGRISHSLEAPLLLGQSALKNLGEIKINGNILTIVNATNNEFDYTGLTPNVYKKNEIVAEYPYYSVIGSDPYVLHRIAITQQYTIIEIIYTGKYLYDNYNISKDCAIIYTDKQKKERYAKIIKTEGIAMEPNKTNIKNDKLCFRLYFPKINLNKEDGIILSNGKNKFLHNISTWTENDYY